MRNLLLILSCTFFILGCGNTLKNSWNNFRAYYNSYYNAEKNFRTGIKKVQEQPVTIDPAEPVRIHPSPVQAGNEDFQKAIDKGARILRKFPGSRWADDAILLIGKSYYYRGEFYPALKKFEELRNASTSSKMEQLAVIWKGRTLLDLKLYVDGTSFLESELNLYPNEWSAERKAEIQALAAEHHAMLGNWKQASEFLSSAVSNIGEKKLLGRTLFLYGQVLERLERYGEAYFAFSQVSENFPGFEYVFWARFKQADVARKEDKLDQAIAIYENLYKDDKNFQRRNELKYEIARTLEMKGQIEQAEKEYKNLLYGEQREQRNLKAEVYYRLGKIYSDQYNDYPVAAAYFDSSSSISAAPQKSGDAADAQSLADAYGKYAQLQRSIIRADSLMRLGSLSDAQLDSALKKVREQMRRASPREQESPSQNTLSNRKPARGGEQGRSSIYGFLNHQNPRFVDREMTEFRIIWGNRPLVDNWRRIEEVRQLSVSRQLQPQDKSNNTVEDSKDGRAIELNLDEIPQSREEMRELQSEKVNAQYELGNLLFLNLNLPDSARYYFHRVIKSEAGADLRPKAMYSLFELFKTGNNRDSLQYWGQRILDEYPDSRYARKVKERMVGEPAGSFEKDRSVKLLDRFQKILASSDSTKACRLRKLAMSNRTSELAPHIHYRSIEEYIRIARGSGSGTDKRDFVGASWDSVRFAVQEFNTYFPDAQPKEKIVKLLELLTPQESTQVRSCKSLGVSLLVKPSMEEFLSTVEYPEKLKGMSVSGQVKYSFTVDEAGEVLSFELVSSRTSLGIEEAFERAFEEYLQFYPPEVEDSPEKIECEVSFPIQL